MRAGGSTAGAEARQGEQANKGRKKAGSLGSRNVAGAALPWRGAASNAAAGEQRGGVVLCRHAPHTRSSWVLLPKQIATQSGWAGLHCSWLTSAPAL